MNKFKTLCNLIENMKNPKEARDQIADYLSNLNKYNQIIACNFMLSTPLENKASGYSKKTVQKVIDTYYDYDKSKKYETLGDMFSGELDIKSNTINGITIQTILSIFKDLSNDGKNKENRLHNFIMYMNDLEKKYFINILLNKLRVRIGMNVLSWSLAEIYDVDNKYVNNLYKKYESIKDIIEILNGGSDKLIIGVPVKPQLAKDISKYMDRIQYPILTEPKFDGSRAQIHVHEDGTIQIFSRSLKDKTGSFPDIVELLKENNIQSGIFDGEIYGINPDGSLMSFNKYQHRINNIKSVNTDEYPVTIRLFDILMYKNEDYTIESQYTRSSMIKCVCNTNIVTSMKFITCEDELIAYHKECVKAGYEGVMIKNPSGTYDCGQGKSEWGNWYKYKPTELRFDVVITGATFGTGDKLSMLSSFNIAVLDNISLRSVGKCGGGFTHSELRQITDRIMNNPIYETLEDYVCWEDPIIIEVKSEKVMRNESGEMGLRFPQFMGFREDKKIDDIDTVSMIEQYIE